MSALGMDSLPQATIVVNNGDAKLPPSLRDPATLSTQTNGLRRATVLSYCIVILLALPLWWYTTSIERLSLPRSRVQQLAQNHLEIPVTICIEGSQPGFVEGARRALSSRIADDPPRWKGVVVDVVDNINCDKTTKDDVYYIFFRNGPTVIQGRRLYLPLSDSNSMVKVIDILSYLLVPYTNSNDPERRVAQYSPHYRLAFSLLNEDADVGNVVSKWAIQEELKALVDPIIHRLKPLHNFTIESQVQIHSPLAFSPRPLDEGYGLTPEDLTVFVNSAEWTLSSSSSNDPVLHFILFIPSMKHRPLKLLRHDGTPSLSSAFLLPQWGGVVLHNPIISSDTLQRQELDAVFLVFKNQLLSLLGVPFLPSEISDSDLTLSDWQLDALARRRALENAQGTQETLLSIVNLVDQIENMPVGEDVKGDVEAALDALTKMYESSTSSLYQTFAFSAESFGLASRAFFNPGMLALLYFPAEHKYGVYAPLFASALIPLIVAALRELSAYRRELKQTKNSAKIKTS